MINEDYIYGKEHVQSMLYISHSPMSINEKEGNKMKLR